MPVLLVAEDVRDVTFSSRPAFRACSSPATRSAGPSVTRSVAPKTPLSAYVNRAFPSVEATVPSASKSTSDVVCLSYGMSLRTASEGGLLLPCRQQ